MAEQLEATGWEKVFSKKYKDHYWANRFSGQATWKRPLTETAAVPIALTDSTPEQSVRGGGTSDSDANSMPAVPWQTQDPVFLPEYFSGHRVIHVTQSERWFLIDDKKKLKDIGGLRYRPSRNLDESAEDLHEHGANWGDLGEGELKDGWLKTTFYTERKIHIVVQREVQSGEIEIIVSPPSTRHRGSRSWIYAAACWPSTTRGSPVCARRSATSVCARETSLRTSTAKSSRRRCGCC